MSLATIYTRSSTGINAPLVTVEAHLANGLPSLSIVGLPEAAVKESKDRVRSAIINCQFEFPAKRITINLAPADLPKEGGRFDLPIALSILVASGQIPATEVANYEFLGELSLGGELRSINGALPAAIACKNSNRTLCLPSENVQEASLISNIDIISAKHLLNICSHLKHQQRIVINQPDRHAVNTRPTTKDFADVHGQHHVKRALEIAAVGKHSLLMLGPPGTGKSMLAARLPSILPLMTEQHAVETASVYSVSQHPINLKQWQIPPIRSPHHTATAVAKVLEVLREPIENGSISISRANHQTEFPARFQLIAAMNPCPCGYLGDASERCQCTQSQISRYRNKISGPLLDRIDMHIEVPRIPHQMLREGAQGGEENSLSIAARVQQSLNRSIQRQGYSNHLLSTTGIKQFCQLSNEDHQLLEQAMDKLGLSHRAYHRILRVSRTIADMDSENNILRKHLTEALSYRRMDRRNNQ